MYKKIFKIGKMNVYVKEEDMKNFGIKGKTKEYILNNGDLYYKPSKISRKSVKYHKKSKKSTPKNTTNSQSSQKMREAIEQMSMSLFKKG